ncbi:hypothetical protein I316_00506 [Kwoniella heveanensis BCC8398]|uniref:Uncharacterized protein n=1 Tax=Kwoniella heveanensis BCC8398 TaxID=1296120 RepID=A0A1B9H285_9TREE|nr:hypothetical protein I316_00506 [Kwoniella heveanensis BCC8398]
MSAISSNDNPFPSLLDAILHYYPVTSGCSGSTSSQSPCSSPFPLATSPQPASIESAHQRRKSTPNLGLFHPTRTSSASRFLPQQPQVIPDIQAPAPQRPLQLDKNDLQPISHDNGLLTPNQATFASPNRSPGGKENMLPDDHMTSPSSHGRNIKAATSPSRPPKLSALSPLQTFSPLQPVKTALPSTGSDAGSLHGRSRSSSVTKSLSRRQSLYAHAAKWGAGDDQNDLPDAASLFSRLTLVKAPPEETGSAIRRHNRSKSSSALVPFTTFAAASDSPATSNRGPRRSFAASSFGGMSPLTLAKSPLPEPGSLHRVHSLHGERDDKGIQRKIFSPDEVVDIAKSLSSPVLMPEGGFKGAELKRRKSAGASSRPGSRDIEKPPVALEPVEYVQMDEDVLLPFVERPAEVAELSNHPANEKLFKLLKAAFPKDPARPNWRELSPEQWNWDEFYKHLTKIDRAESPDYDWIFRARQAVRARSVALWEKLGVCLGCDGDLLNAGSEDDIPQSWGGLGLGDEGEYDPSMNQVWIEGLEAVDTDARAKAERDLAAAFGEIVEDENEQASAGMTALLGSMDAIGEGPDEGVSAGPAARAIPTTAQMAGSSHKIDPMLSPSAQFHSPPRATQNARQSRSKSFVGLQICTSPTAATNQYVPRSPSSQLQTPVLGTATLPVYERGPGSPLFPSSFSSLSAEPNLGRSASVAIAGGGRPPPPVQDEFSRFDRRGLMRKPSGAGLSESEFLCNCMSAVLNLVTGTITSAR